MRIFLLLFCALTLLATSGCLIREGHGHGDDRGHWDHHGDRGDHGGDHHGDDHH